MIAPKQITLTINGKRCLGQEGDTILQVAQANDIFVPTLCHMKHLSPWGGCRLCIVEIKGSPKVVPSCSTPATDGSEVIATSPRLHELRRSTLELLFSERNHICPICEMNQGDCGLQHQGYVHGIDAVRFPYLYPTLPVDTSGKYFALDHNRCILCTRCVRACEEMEGIHTLDISHRGIHNRVVVDIAATFGTSDTCTNCGACVASCPTGALFDKASAFRGKLNSSQVVRTTCLECPVGCGLEVYTRDNRIVNVFGDFESPINRGHLCVRGRYETWAEPRERILTPLVRRDGKLESASWNEAVDSVRNAARRFQTEQRAMLLSPRLTNETARAMRKLAPKIGRVGVVVVQHEEALCRVNGGPTPPASALDQLQDADAIIILGARPSRDNGVVAARIRTTVRRRGAKLLIFHSRKSDLDRYADVSAYAVSLERAFWKQVASLLQDVHRPVLVYGPDAMTSIGVTVMERLIKIFEVNTDGRTQSLQLVALPVSTNGCTWTGAEIETVEDVGLWLGAKPLRYLQVVASDEPDGGAHLLRERHVRALLDNVDCLVVQASYRSALTERAQVILPSALWSEKSGTVTNFEGRELPVRQVVPPRGEARDDREILETLFS
ncbi:MAG TPA: molybdopterin-dependent oxidoreductase [Verrucomicrobiae bacterium]|nr:molybdopterin-dependent oxidoreductase [Verrucomicrobiae bacterium]